MSSERAAETEQIDYRAQYEASMRRRARIEEILDVVLGEDDVDGAGEGLVTDVLLALAVAWDQGAQARAQADPVATVRDLNPYRCRCEAYIIHTDYGTGIEHDIDRSSCPFHDTDEDDEQATPPVQTGGES